GELIRLLQSRLAEFHLDPEIEKAFYQIELAHTQHLTGDAGAKVNAEQARNTLERLYRDQAGDATVLALLSIAQAGIGERDSALNLAHRAVMLEPRAKDPITGPTWEESLALVQTLVGENSGAILTLTQLLRTPYESFMYNPTG